MSCSLRLSGCVLVFMVIFLLVVMLMTIWLSGWWFGPVRV